jgi:hypothetical protein
MRELPFHLWSADGFGPLEVSIGIQLDDIDIRQSPAPKELVMPAMA